MSLSFLLINFPCRTRSGSKVSKTDYQARGEMYLPDEARFSYLLKLPEGANLAKAHQRDDEGHRARKRRAERPTPCWTIRPSLNG